MRTAYWIIGLLCLFISSCSSQNDEPEPTYNWWVLITVNMYEIGTDTNDLKWVKESRRDERYELNKTESYIKEQQAMYDGKRTYSEDYVYIYSYTYSKVDNIPVNASKTFP